MTSARIALLALSVALAACASANDEPPQPIPGRDAGLDAPARDGGGSDGAIVDAPPADAAIPMFTLRQTTTTTTLPNGSVACNTNGVTRDNRWFRVFRLADAGVTGGGRITAVSFGVQQAAGLPALDIRIGTYSGSVQPPPATLDTSLITPIASTTYVVPDVSTTMTRYVTVPITANVPALAQVVVEVAVGDQTGTSKRFYLGGNTDGQTAPAYLMSTACSFAQPRDTTTIGAAFANSHLVITATGTN